MGVSGGHPKQRINGYRNLLHYICYIARHSKVTKYEKDQ